jgi:hypothetical protein
VSIAADAWSKPRALAMDMLLVIGSGEFYPPSKIEAVLKGDDLQANEQ